MADNFTPLEEKLDARYIERLNQLSFGVFVPNWDDYNFRIGYLACIREIGEMIKSLRSPEKTAETGEIPSVLEEVKNG